MSRTFAYARVSTTEQTTENQAREIAAAGFTIESHRVIEESISGGTPAADRPGFSKLLDRLERGDVLIITKLDRLGRNAMDVRATVERLAAAGVRVHCLQLGGADLTSNAGMLVMQVLNAMAEFERGIIIERTNAGLANAKAKGQKLGRRHSLTPDARAAILKRLADGEKVYALAKDYNTTRQTIMRVRDAAHI